MPELTRAEILKRKIVLQSQAIQMEIEEENIIGAVKAVGRILERMVELNDEIQGNK